MAIDPAGPEPRDPAGPRDPEPPETSDALPVPEVPIRVSRTGRNLPVAIGVGAGLGGLVLLTLLTVKATFLIYVAAAIGVALIELAGAFRKSGINIPVIPVAAGGVGMLTCMYWLGPPAATGMTAVLIPPLRKAPASSVRATPMAAAT